LNLEQGQTIHPTVYDRGWDEHGTAVVGITSSIINQYGCNGLVPNADIFTYPEWTVEENYRRIKCISQAIVESRPGDVVLLEMQTRDSEEKYVPAEYDPAVWALVKSATDAGIIVVAAAGNGKRNLDDDLYKEYIDRGDSGAIIVGSCNPKRLSERTSSTYGSRVNLSAWGSNVFTLGYGHFIEYGEDKNQRYTNIFSGTSSASALVAAACVSIQALHLNAKNEFLSPNSIRELLINTGNNMPDSLKIGPLLNVRNAIKFIENSIPTSIINLVQNYPNPFSGSTKIKFFLREPSSVRFDIFDILGRHVYSKEYNNMLYGFNIIEFQNNNLPSGTYFYRIKNNKEIKMQKMLIIK